MCKFGCRILAGAGSMTGIRGQVRGVDELRLEELERELQAEREKEAKALAALEQHRAPQPTPC